MQLHIKKNKITQRKSQLIFYLLPVSTSGEVWFLGTTQPTRGFVQNGQIYFKYRSGPSICCCILNVEWSVQVTDVKISQEFFGNNIISECSTNVPLLSHYIFWGWKWPSTYHRCKQHFYVFILFKCCKKNLKCFYYNKCTETIWKPPLVKAQMH